ncbi:MAG: vitamin B12-dependent ribonucleotide reductase [Verrucomicrobia bacterium]|nr:vitamin B12-dependent ribonucleotide reductase [Verrucomicrobiota bacterium]
MDSLLLTENGRRVLERRYLIRDEKGQPVEQPCVMFRRVARNIAEADFKYDPNADVEAVTEEFYGLMTRLEFMPNSPTLMNAGRALQQLSACYVVPIDDSMESIFKAVRDAAIIHKSGGGTGFSFSRLRPRNDVVSTTYGLSSGPVSFMHVFDAATDAVNQGGFRRGANMAIMDYTHPDILGFIGCKRSNDRITNFNISVGIDEQFMRMVADDDSYSTINPRGGEPVATVRAREVFEAIVENAWHNGDPGIVFLDRINRDNPTPALGRIESTNPCGEQPLLGYEACNLGSINLARFVDETGIIWERLREAVRTAVHFLDNVIDQSRFPLPEITEMVHGNRKIGLGIMGWADLLIALGVPYNSQEAIDLAGQLMRFIRDEGHRASQDLAEERGAFPNFKGSIYDTPGARPMRNATVTTIAPTGSISIIAGCSSGIEPLFAVSFVRNVMDNTELIEVNPAFERVARQRGFFSDELMQRIAHEGSVAHIDEVPDEVRRVFATAHDISPEWHLRMQAAFQRYTDNAVSKTVNFPREATRDDVSRVFTLAHELGCKGVTIYRDGSREQQVLSTGKTTQGPGAKVDPNGGNGTGAGEQTHPPKPVHKRRPLILSGKTIHMETGCGSLYVTINEDEEGVFEVFNTMGKAGGCAASQCEAIGRLISLAWRSGVDVERVVKQLRGIHCQKPFGFGDNRVNSCADAIGRAIQIFLKQNGGRVTEVRNMRNGEACPACGGTVEHEGGCSVCHDCGYSDCA